MPAPQLIQPQLLQQPSPAAILPRTTQPSAVPALSIGPRHPSSLPVGSTSGLAPPAATTQYLHTKTATPIPHCCLLDSRLAPPAPGPHHSRTNPSRSPTPVSTPLQSPVLSPVSSSQPMSPRWSWSVLLHSLPVCPRLTLEYTRAITSLVPWYQRCDSNSIQVSEEKLN